MTRQNIALGTSANDGTGDSLRAAGTKINENIVELYQQFGGDSDVLPGKVVLHNNITVTADGALSVAFSYYVLNKATALAISLPDGTYVGEEKTFTNRGVGTATITPSNFAGGTSFALATGEGCKTTWDGANWYITANNSQLTIV